MILFLISIIIIVVIVLIINNYNVEKRNVVARTVRPSSGSRPQTYQKPGYVPQLPPDFQKREVKKNEITVETQYGTLHFQRPKIVIEYDEKYDELASGEFPQKEYYITTKEDLNYEYLPEFTAAPDKEYNEKSSQGDNNYKVNLNRKTCTCPDFIERRSMLPVNSYNRLCKHLRSCYRKKKELFKFDALTNQFIMNDYYNDDFYLRFSLTQTQYKGRIIGLSWKNNSPWVAVHFPNKSNSEYFRYSYNMIEKRWSYRRNPPVTTEIKNYLSTLFEIKECDGANQSLGKQY